jgi:O-antigen ligase
VTLPPGSGQTERFAFNPPAPSGQTPPPSVAAAPVVPSFRRKASSVAQEPKDWAFIWTLVFTAVLFLRPQDVFPPLGALHLAEVSALLGLVSLFAGRMARRQSISRVTPELAGVLAFGAVMLVTAPFSIWFGGAIGTFQDLYLKVILVYLLAVNVLTSPRRLERLTWILVLALGYLGSRAVFDYVRGVNVIRGGTRVMGSVGGMMENPNDMALNMVVFLPLAVFLALRSGSTVKRLIAAGCAAAMMGAIVATGSRGGFLGFAVMLAVLAVTTIRKHPAFVVAGALAVLCALPVVPQSYWRRIASITDESKDDVQSSQARRTLMGESLDAFLQNPVTGVGAGQFKDWNPQGRTEAWHEAHNVWLQVSAELGIFGVGIFLFLVFRAFYSVIRTRRLLRRMGVAAGRAVAPRGRKARPPETEEALLDAHSAAMAASLAGWFVCAFFSSVAYNWTFYYLLALAAAPVEILRHRVPAVPRRSAVAGRLAPSRVGA